MNVAAATMACQCSAPLGRIASWREKYVSAWPTRGTERKNSPQNMRPCPWTTILTKKATWKLPNKQCTSSHFIDSMSNHMRLNSGRKWKQEWLIERQIRRTEIKRAVKEYMRCVNRIANKTEEKCIFLSVSSIKKVDLVWYDQRSPLHARHIYASVKHMHKSLSRQQIGQSSWHTQQQRGRIRILGQKVGRLIHGRALATQDKHFVHQVLAGCQASVEERSTRYLHAYPRPPTQHGVSDQRERQIANGQWPVVNVALFARRINQFYSRIGVDLFEGAHFVVVEAVQLSYQRCREALFQS